MGFLFLPPVDNVSVDHGEIKTDVGNIPVNSFTSSLLFLFSYYY
jgi:hypothetical protein